MVRNKQRRTQRSMKWMTVKLRTLIIPIVKMKKTLETLAPIQMNQMNLNKKKTLRRTKK